MQNEDRMQEIIKKAITFLENRIKETEDNKLKDESTDHHMVRGYNSIINKAQQDLKVIESGKARFSDTYYCTKEVKANLEYSFIDSYCKDSDVFSSEEKNAIKAQRIQEKPSIFKEIINFISSLFARNQSSVSVSDKEAAGEKSGALQPGSQGTLVGEKESPQDKLAVGNDSTKESTQKTEDAQTHSGKP